MSVIGAPPAAPTATHLDSDSGTSASDNITNDPTPTFSGFAPNGTTVQLFVDSTLVGGGSVSDGKYSITTSTLTHGTHVVTARAIDSFDQTSDLSAPMSFTIDTVAPTVSAAVFAVSPHRIAFTFSENLNATITDQSLAMNNLTDGSSLTAGNIDATGKGNSALFTFTGLSGGRIADGLWSASVAATDVAGNAVAAAPFDFIYAGNSASHATTVRRSADGKSVEVFTSAGGRRVVAPEIVAPFATLAQIMIEGTSAHDTVTLALQNGNPAPSGGAGFAFIGAAGNDQINVSGPGTIGLYGDLGTASPGVTLNVDNATVGLASPRVHLGALQVTNGGVEMSAAQSLLVSKNLLLTNSTLDLRDGDLILDYDSDSPLSTVQAQINLARAGGAWTGAGITSSAARNATPRITTLGAMEAADWKALPGNATALFANEAVDQTAVLIKYTYYGDTNFDGRVNFDDYARIDAGFNNHRTGWINGDFNGSGSVNFDDYTLIDLAFNQHGPQL